MDEKEALKSYIGSFMEIKWFKKHNFYFA